MTLLQKVKTWLLGKTNSNEVPEGYCPNCWGRQEYGGAFLEAVHQEKIDLNNVEQKTGWVNAYAVRYLEGIKLKPVEEGLVCGQCSTVYKAS